MAAVSAAARVAAESTPVIPASPANLAAVSTMRQHVRDLHAKLVTFVREDCDPALEVYRRQHAEQADRFAEVRAPCTGAAGPAPVRRLLCRRLSVRLARPRRCRPSWKS